MDLNTQLCLSLPSAGVTNVTLTQPVFSDKIFIMFLDLKPLRWSNPPSSTPKESVLCCAHDTAYTSFCIDIYFHFLGLFTGMELLNPLDLAFWRMARLFSQWVGHFTTSNEILECLHLCQHTLLSFCYGHPSESDMASHCCTCFCAV